MIYRWKKNNFGKEYNDLSFTEKKFLDFVATLGTDYVDKKSAIKSFREQIDEKVKKDNVVYRAITKAYTDNYYIVLQCLDIKENLIEDFKFYIKDILSYENINELLLNVRYEINRNNERKMFIENNINIIKNLITE